MAKFTDTDLLNKQNEVLYGETEQGYTNYYNGQYYYNYEFKDYKGILDK